MQYWAFILFITPGCFAAVVPKAENHIPWSSGVLAQLHPEEGIEGSNGRYIFENGQDIKLFCTVTEAGLNEGLNISDLRLETPSGDIVKPNSTSNNVTVSFIIANASANDSELESWRCWSKQMKVLICTWSIPKNPVWTDYVFYIQTDGKKMAECRRKNATVDGKAICEWSKNGTPPYNPGETDMNITVAAKNPFGNAIFIYPFDHYRNIKIDMLDDVAVGELGEETLDVTWNIPGNMEYYNVSIVHNIRWIHEWKDELQYANVVNYTIQGNSLRMSWNYTLTGLIPNTDYKVEIRAIVDGAEFSDLWSNSSMVEGKTKSKVPDRSPDVPPGSFYVKRNDDGLRDIHIYWIPLSEWEHYGDNFTYRVEGQEISSPGKELQPTSMTETSATFKNLSAESFYKFYIVSSNELGMAPPRSSIDVDKEEDRIPCPTIQTFQSDGEYILEWKALDEERTTNFTVFWCLSHPAWPTCDSSINWEVVPRNTTTFKLKSNESLKFAVSVNAESGGSGMGWEKTVFEPEADQNFPVAVVVIAVVLGMALVVTAALGGNRIFKKVDRSMMMMEKLLGPNTKSQSDPATKTQSQVQACVASSEEDTKYICVDLEDEENASKEEHDDDRFLGSDYDVSLDEGELMKKFDSIRMATLKKVQSIAYVQASALPAQKQASSLHLTTNSELEASPQGKGQEHRGESMQSAASCESPYVEVGALS
ncbi:unnamed protein product [Darwinula stevensoni]|uniref:Fibronectin type-III domain-containing protein n=1 Tax=Darwinula stevensoni TaxID=69355 RepID=A0A7R9ACJ0_9CRUS|nr:unnamed protein product [Darwinula stevensoni]CAG0900415.1 unnamed protein product [Darwinula stevensoni]